jgi:hypothetical protein
MSEYKGNSNRAKTESEAPAKKLEKIVKGEVTAKKKTGISKFANLMVAEDVPNIKSYVIMDVIIPSLRRAITDIVISGIETVFGEGSRSSKKRDRSDRFSYDSCSRDRDRRDYNYRARATYEYDDITLRTLGEAKRVLDRMDETIEEYGTVSVGDLYDLVGISGTHTDTKYGWTDLRNARPERVRDGYLIKLPRAIPLD